MTPTPPARGAFAGAALALGAGFALALFDVALGVLRTELGGMAASDLLDPLALGTLVGALLFAASRALLARILAGRVERGALDLALLAGLATFVLVDASGTPGEGWSAGLGFVAAVAVGALAARASRGLALDAGRLALAVVVLAEALAFLLLLRGGLGLGAVGRAAAVVALALVVPATLGVWSRAPRLRARGPAFLVALAALVLAMPLGARAVPRVLHPRQVASSSATPRVPRVLLIVLDTLRFDALSCLADSAPPTPRVDALAARSLAFTRAWAPAPWTLPSVASMMTGVSPLVHRATSPRGALPPELSTLAEHLAAAGYATGAIGRNPFLLPRSGLARGFADYRMRPAPAVELRCLSAALLTRWRGAPRGLELSARELTDEALAWIEERQREPFFLWLHYYDAHLDYAPPPELVPPGPPAPGLGSSFGGLLEVRSGAFAPTPEQRRWIRALYDAEVRALDRELGRLLDGLEERELFDDALVVLTSDHGEEFWEHGGFEHGHAFHEELLHVPLLVKLPGQREGRRLEEPVSLVGLAPTLLTLCGLPVDPSRMSQPAWLDERGEPASPAAEPVHVAAGNLYFDPRIALRSGDTKYVHGVVDGEEALYDLARDPRERRRLEERDPGLLGTARARLQAALDEAEELRARLGLGAPPTSPLTARQLELLRGGGYFEVPH